MTISRRSLFHLAGAAPLAYASASKLKAQTAPNTVIPWPPATIIPTKGPSTVSLIRGEERRKMVYESLLAIDRELAPALKRKKSVLIKPNLTSTTNQLASTHIDTVRGIMDYIAPRFKGPVVIAESASGETNVGYDNFKYHQLISEYRSNNIKLIDLNEEARYELIPVINRNLHVVPLRLAARLLDPDAFIICAAIVKTHNTVVATAAVKNMVVGAPLRSKPKETPAWSDKRLFHAGFHQQHYNMLVTSQKLAPFWGATVVDGYEGMEGNGPVSGNPVPSRIAIASTDYIAADRVSVEVMGIDPKWVGYLQYCEQVGIGNYDINKIKVIGETIASVRKKYNLHPDINRQLGWLGPLSQERIPGAR